MLKYVDFISRDYVRTHPEWWFVYGDNLLRTGAAGQAKAMRGEPNAIGIATKVRPDLREGAFFSDKLFNLHRQQMDTDLDAVESKLRLKKTVVWPSKGIGTGLSEMPTRCPKLYNYLVEREEYFAAIYGKE